AAVAGRRFERGRSLIGPCVLGGVVVMAWIPPLVEQLTHNPGNLGRLASFFTSGSGGGARPGLSRQLAFAGRDLAAVPFGIIYKGSLTPGTVSLRGGTVGIGLFVVAAAILIFVAHRRDDRLAHQLGLVSLVVAVA